ncbi:MAG: hypothetical protein IPJ97_18150 [Proteobacteria bacterium]|nr:hypothetical protein [Pseudomonadota bacterium]
MFGARLRITALRAAHGPGIELLEYLTPRTGRAAPIDTAANDHWQWQVVLRSDDLQGAWQGIRTAQGTPVSPGPVALDGALGVREALLVRDPDGHADLLAQP